MTVYTETAMTLHHVFNVIGDGHWSDRKAPVRVEYFAVDGSTDEDGTLYGELVLKFNTIDWKVERDGLIYTDSFFLREFQSALRSLGFSREASEDVGYSEHGRQGVDYVSFDVGNVFMNEWMEREDEHVSVEHNW